MNQFELKYINGHVEIYDRNGVFLFSADTEQEARGTLRDWEAI